MAHCKVERVEERNKYVFVFCKYKRLRECKVDMFTLFRSGLLSLLWVREMIIQLLLSHIGIMWPLCDHFEPVTRLLRERPTMARGWWINRTNWNVTIKKRNCPAGLMNRIRKGDIDEVLHCSPLSIGLTKVQRRPRKTFSASRTMGPGDDQWRHSLWCWHSPVRRLL